ncbi:hypothetical protein K2173_026291 [Erythroxylum novogranatense]|uniref:WAT1-related protein n=1 Tax=Erythroxylum novogranatense TaxID=1862640 RepID=A0AAV8SBX1_9ROSI|nr:hypothetical protein K2173_026291 [Erythroxylum novogranatense]
MAIAYAYRVVYWRFMPHFLMIFAQICYSFLYFITEAAFDIGLNPHVYVTYRHILGGVAVFPFAYFLERKVRPKLRPVLFLEMCGLSLLGCSLTINMYFASMSCTSPTFITAVINTIPSITFVLAIVLRLEVVDIKNWRGRAKILGTLFSLAGVLIITLYKGPRVQSLQVSPLHMRSNPVPKNWIKGSILVVASCISWSIWFIWQAYALKRYPAPLSLTTWINCVGGVQSALITAFLQHKRAAWSVSLNMEFWSIIYSGILSCGLFIVAQIWCTKEKGPVFVTMFTPLSTMLVEILAFFLFGEELHAGSILGGVIVIIGLYLLLYGKEGDQVQKKSQEQSFPTCDEDKDAQVHEGTAAAK